MSAALILHRLQQVDRQLDQAQTRLSAIRKTLEDDAEMRQALMRLEKADREHQISERALKQAESDVENQQIKIQQTEASLYSGHIKNPKELQDLQNEAAALRRLLTTLEERQLNAMQEAEKTAAALQRAKDEIERIQTRLGAEHGKLIEEQAALSRELERLSSERQATVSAVASEMLEMYEGLRRQKGGVAIAEISDSACAACGTTLTAALQQSARSAVALTHCPSCGRILYAG